MIVTKKYINRLREKSFMKISPEAEKLILEEFVSDPGIDTEGIYRTYTEQDIIEHIRKMIR